MDGSVKISSEDTSVIRCEVNIAFELFKTFSTLHNDKANSLEKKLLKRGSSMETMNLIYEFRNS